MNNNLSVLFNKFNNQRVCQEIMCENVRYSVINCSKWLTKCPITGE